MRQHNRSWRSGASDLSTMSKSLAPTIPSWLGAGIEAGVACLSCMRRASFISCSSKSSVSPSSCSTRHKGGSSPPGPAGAQQAMVPSAMIACRKMRRTRRPMHVCPLLRHCTPPLSAAAAAAKARNAALVGGLQALLRGLLSSILLLAPEAGEPGPFWFDHFDDRFALPLTLAALCLGPRAVEPLLASRFAAQAKALRFTDRKLLPAPTLFPSEFLCPTSESKLRGGNVAPPTIRARRNARMYSRIGCSAGCSVAEVAHNTLFWCIL